MNLTVIGPRVMIRPDNLPEMTADGSLHLIHDRQKSTMTGTVVAVGDGPELSVRAANAALDKLTDCYPCEDDCTIDMAIAHVRETFKPEHAVNVGERVIFSPDRGEELIFEKDVLICMTEDEILAVIE